MRLRIAIVLAITAACLVWVLWGLDFSQVRISLGDANWLWVGSVYGVYLTNHCVRSLRLRILLDRMIPFGDMFAITTVGFLAINVIPLRMGEFVRPYLLLERHQVPLGSSLAAIFIERLLDLMSLLALISLMVWTVDLPAQGIVVGEIDVVSAGQTLIGGALGLGILGLVVLLVVGNPVIRLVERLIPVPALAARVATFMRAFHDGLLGLVKRPGQAILTIGMTAFMWSGIVVATWAALQGFEGVPRSLGAALTTWTATITGMMVAPTPGFFGSYEAFCSAGLKLWGTDHSVAATFAVVLHLTQFSFIVGLGSLFLVREGLSLRDVVARSRQVAVG